MVLFDSLTATVLTLTRLWLFSLPNDLLLPRHGMEGKGEGRERDVGKENVKLGGGKEMES